MSQDAQPPTDKSLKRKHDGEGNGQGQKRKKRSKPSKGSQADPAAKPEAETKAPKQNGTIIELQKKRRHNKKDKKGTTSWALSSPQAGRFVDRDPIFLNNTIITAVGSEIRVLDIETSLVTAALPPRFDKEIVSFDALQTSEENLVRVLYADGVLVDWDWTEGSIEESKPATKHVDVYRLTSVGEQIASVFTTWQQDVCTIRLDGIEIHSTKQHIIDLKVLNDATTIVAYSERAVLLGRRETTDKYSWVELPWARRITCFDARASQAGKDFDIVVGQDDGVLQLYSGLAPIFKTATLPTPRTLHWHRKAVGSVKFTPDGSYLISGGQETVLVIWQLETGQKLYLPNLTAAIERVAVNSAGNRYALKMSDNSIMVLSTSELKPVANFAGLQSALARQVIATRDSSDKDRLLLAVPSDRHANARPFLQTFDLGSDKHISRQALTRNNITDLNTTPNKLPIDCPDVQHIAVSQNGQWLATIDIWTPPYRDVAYLSTEEHNDDEQKLARREIYLKLWQWHADAMEWRLNSRIDQPHASNGIFKLVRDNSKTGFITIGEDSVVKIWRPQKKFHPDQQDYDTEWTCKHSINLEKVQETDLEADGAPTGAALALSEDSSLLAAAVVHAGSQVVYLIDTIAGEIKSTHDHIAAPQLLELAFLDRYLIALSQGWIRVWDVVQDKLHYTTSINDAKSGMLAVSRLDNAVAVALPAFHNKPASVTVLRVQPGGVAAVIRPDVAVAALLTQPKSRGFLLIHEDATIRTLSPSGSIVRFKASEAVIPSEEPMPVSDAVLAIEGVAKVSDLPPQEDDRVVVRPEQLANILEVDGINVRTMFSAVLGLFARKP